MSFEDSHLNTRKLLAVQPSRCGAYDGAGNMSIVLGLPSAFLETDRSGT